MSPERFASASGLRPMSAFVVVAAVVLVVAGWVASLTGRRAAEQPDRVVSEHGRTPSYVVRDAGGRILAQSVPRFDLVMSPRSMWQAHTPDHMAERLAGALGGEASAEGLLAAMLPGMVDGVIEVEAWSLPARRARAVEEWIEAGAGLACERLPGVWLERRSPNADGADGAGGAGMRYRLVWQPATLLAREVRELYGYDSAWAWARHLGSSLALALGWPEPADAAEAEERRSEVWRALLSSGFCRPWKGIPSERVMAVRRLLKEEGVAPWQMRIAYETDRVYPSGRHELFGSWGFTRPEQTEARAREGLELSCRELLAREEWSFLAAEPPVYTWLQDRSVRGERANGYVSFAAGSEPPVVGATIDLDLMRAVRRELEEVMAEHRPAVAMAIVLDVESGAVLAVDSLEEYAIQPFAPVYHVFTPGSTFKVLTMAVALQEGVVTPEERFEVGDGAYRLVDPSDGRSRLIHEAEGSLTGEISATEALAYSVNAGLAQIGVRVPAEAFRGYLELLGYGRGPGSGLGPEKAGYLRELPWKYRFTHASVSFGHEVSTTLWQHAAALATVLRGGVWKPLYLLDEVAQSGRSYAVPRAEGRRVLGERACRSVGDMLALAAREGTGDEAAERLLAAARAAGRADLDHAALRLRTKTGTAQKVPTELCVHVELRERERARERGLAWTRQRYRELRSLPRPHGSCYTSSMCAVARRPDYRGDGGDGREVMVLVVVDEPRGREKFGARVAGPAAMDILAEALGFTRDGRAPSLELVAGFGASASPLRNALDEPWRELWR